MTLMRNERGTAVLSGACCFAMGAILAWAHGANLAESCRQAAEQEREGRQIAHLTTSLQLEVEKQEREADRIKWEVRSIQETAEKVKAQQELGAALAAAHHWTDADGRSVLDLPPLTRWQLLERTAKDVGKRVALGLATAGR